MVVPMHKRTVDHDAGITHHVDRRLEVLPLHVPPLSHLPQIFGAQRLEAEQRARATALRHHANEVPVARDVDRRLAEPVDAHPPHGIEQFPGFWHIHEQVVIDEEDQRAPGLLDLRTHITNRALPKAVPVEGVNGTEVAIESTSTSVLHQRNRRILLSLEHGAIGERLAGEAGVVVLLVARTQASTPGVGNNGRPDAFGIAKRYRVGERATLVRQERWMVSPHHDRNPTAAICRRELEGPPRRIGFNGHRHEIGWLVERDSFDSLVMEDHLDIGRGEGAQDGEDQRLHGITRAPAMHTRPNERDFQCNASDGIDAGASSVRFSESAVCRLQKRSTWKRRRIAAGNFTLPAVSAPTKSWSYGSPSA